MFTPLDFLPIEYVPDAFAQIQSIPSSDDGPQNYMDTKFYRAALKRNYFFEMEGTSLYHQTLVC